MNSPQSVVTRSSESILATNKVLKNTYMLLALTLLFSAVTAWVSMQVKPSSGMSLVSSIGAIALIWFVLPKTANSAAGIGVVFAITGLLGFSLGPMLAHYLQMANGAQVVMTALGGTGVIFLALSGYVLTTQKDFTFMGGFLITGLLVAFGAILLNLFLNIPALSLAISAAVIMIMSGFILYDTSRIVRGGETNYVNATVGLYLNIYNIFVSLLQILGIFGDE
ncbi:MAG: Bax inhibitor-1/YccA family protein [Gammaproteobacteria bacterium]